MLSLIIFFPALAALLGFFIDDKNAKAYGMGVALLELCFVLFAFCVADFSDGYSFYYEFSFGLLANYAVGADGLSMALVLMACIVAVIALGASPSSKAVVVSVLVFLSSMLGAFLSVDGLLFYIFWEINLIPMLYLIGFYNKAEQSSKAALKFFIYGFGGSVFLLFGILYMAYLHMEQTGAYSFNFGDWAGLSIDASTQMWLFIAFGISFAVKAPLFPLHSWLPSAHKVAPTVASVLLALKMGTYGFIRLSLPLFPDACVAFYPLMTVLAIITIIYGAFVAFGQDDIKMTIAYSTISHAGMVVLAIFSLSAIGVAGALFLMFAHGVVAAGIFYMVGIISDMANARGMKDFGGLARLMPIYSTIFGVLMLAFVGLPLTAGFVGEFLALLGAFRLSFWLSLAAGVAIIVGAIYMLNLFRNVIFSKATWQDKFKDISPSQALILVPTALLVLVLGVAPNILLKSIDAGAISVAGAMYSSAQNPQNKALIKTLNPDITIGEDK